LRSNLGEGGFGIRRNQRASVKMLCFSATVDIFQFLNYSGSGNVAYIMMLDTPKVNEKGE
jgi:hypothetical protein